MLSGQEKCLGCGENITRENYDTIVSNISPSITTTDRKKGILSTLHSNLPTRSTALWPCLPRSDFRSKTDQIEEASL